MRSVCVFSGSSFGRDPVYADAARALALELVGRRLRLVYGGASVGLMGVLADTVLAGGGEVFGVIPQHLVDKEIAHPGLSDLRVTGSMHERKMLMADLADGFVALPGGFGTLEEFAEVVTWTQLGLQHKPCGLLDVGATTPGCWHSSITRRMRASFPSHNADWFFRTMTPVGCWMPLRPGCLRPRTSGPEIAANYPRVVPQLRLALAQVDPTVGDLAGNADLVLEWTGRAAEQGAHLVAFPEMMLTGYPIEDLALRPSFVEASRATLESVARRLADAGHGDVLVVVGYLDGQRGAAPVVGTPRGAPQNALAFPSRRPSRGPLCEASPAELRRL